MPDQATGKAIIRICHQVLQQGELELLAQTQAFGTRMRNGAAGGCRISVLENAGVGAGAKPTGNKPQTGWRSIGKTFRADHCWNRPVLIDSAAAVNTFKRLLGLLRRRFRSPPLSTRHSGVSGTWERLPRHNMGRYRARQLSPDRRGRLNIRTNDAGLNQCHPLSSHPGLNAPSLQAAASGNRCQTGGRDSATGNFDRQNRMEQSAARPSWQALAWAHSLGLRPALWAGTQESRLDHFLNHSTQQQNLLLTKLELGVGRGEGRQARQAPGCRLEQLTDFKISGGALEAGASQRAGSKPEDFQAHGTMGAASARMGRHGA